MCCATSSIDRQQGRMQLRRLWRLQRDRQVDGRLVCSCLMLAVEAEGTIETIEGMARGHDLHPLQRKFLEHAALQCGFCTPGLLIAAKALLDRNPNRKKTEAPYWLAGNLCRCTGYDKVIRAVLDASRPAARRVSSRSQQAPDAAGLGDMESRGRRSLCSVTLRCSRLFGASLEGRRPRRPHALAPSGPFILRGPRKSAAASG